jgi:hypothetical protein
MQQRDYHCSLSFGPIGVTSIALIENALKPATILIGSHRAQGYIASRYGRRRRNVVLFVRDSQ